MSAPPLRIAGAGPSGLAAAITLARAGRAVEVFEARATVGHRFIGDLQVLESASCEPDAAELLAGFGIAINFDFAPAREAVLFDHRLRARAVRSQRPFGYFLRRGPEAGTLDRGLLAQAEAAGARIVYNRRVRDEPVEIVATGPAACDGLAREMTFSTPLADRTWVLFDQRLAPGGYAYLFVRRGFATFGTAITAEFKAIDDRFAACLRRFQEVEAFTPAVPRNGYSYMNFTLKDSATERGAHFVGEAAGFQDYLFGLGIRYALTTGVLAARALLENRSYDELWRRELHGRQPTSLVNRALYEGGGNLGLAFFTRRAARGDFREYLLRWQRGGLWKRALSPLIAAIWRRRDPCRHHLPGHWCRPPNKATRSEAPALGEIPT